MRQILLCAIGLCSMLSLADTCAAEATPDGASVETISDQNSGHAIHDLGLVAPTANSDDPTPAPSSTSTASSAEPIPELPTWALMLVFFLGLGLAGFKKSRKDRLSPGVE
jgi:hypothetical protein